MAYRIAGAYVAACNCATICPCPTDQTPSGPNGECRGTIVFDIREGDLDGVDLGNTKLALYNWFPSNLSAGNWKVGLVIDEGASDDQAKALERIISGQEGGPFGDLAALIGEVVGVERDRVTYSNGDAPSGSVGGSSEFRFEPLRGPDGSPTTVRNAMFGFAPEFQIGRTTGRSDRFGLGFDPSYGEAAEFEFSTEMTGEIHPRA